MNRSNSPRLAASLVACAALVALPSLAIAGPHDHDDHGKNFKAELDGYEEVPAINSDGGGRFKAKLNAAGTELAYELSYQDTGSTVTQAHIHFAQKGVNGGIVVFLCTNLGNAPASPPATPTQACPPAPATITGTITAASVSAGAAAQGFAAGDFGALLDALRAGIAYANVHTTGFPGGEIRGQVRK